MEGEDKEIEIILVDRADITERERAMAGDLLAAVCGNSMFLGRGYGYVKPLYWVFAKCDGAIIGTRMTCHVPSDSDIYIAGFGDMVVAPDFRRRGLATEMTRRAIDEAVNRNADLLMTSTEPMARHYKESFGFVQATPGSFLFPTKADPNVYEDDVNLWIRWLMQNPPTTAIRLATIF